MNVIQIGAIAAAAGLLVGGFAGYRYADGRAAKVVVKAMTAEEKRRLAAYDGLTKANAKLSLALDAASGELELVRREKPLTLLKTNTRLVEVPSGATTVECLDPSVGDEFARLWDDAAAAYNSLPRTD